MSTLNDHLLAAHEAGDITSLIDLYTQAGDSSQGSDAAAFYLTHAMVFALELGDPRAAVLRARLVAEGREEA